MNVVLEGVGVAVGLLLTCACATVVHEASHYAAARAVGRAAEFDLRECAVYFVVPPEGPTWRDEVIAGAPVAVGLVVGTVAVLAPISLPWWGVIPWALLTLAGIRNDFDFTAHEILTAE